MKIQLLLLLLICPILIYSQSKKNMSDACQLQLLPKYDNSAAYTVTRTDYTITLRDGVKLDALKFIPVGAPPAGGWPTVIMVHGYGDNKNTLAAFCQAQAEYGYYTATFSIRGQGNSGGVSNLISTIEAQDLVEFVNYIKRDSVNGSSPGKILIMGGSQGGLLPYMAASSYGLNVKTLISALAPPNFASSWIENGCIKMTFLWTIDYTPDTARYNNQVIAMRSWVMANNKSKWDSLAYWLPQGRDFMSNVPNNKVPLIMEGSWQDKFFNGSGIIQAASLNTGSAFRMYLGAVQGHGGDHSTTEDNWHMQFFNDWFFYWLFGIQNGTLTAAKYQYASTTLPFVTPYYTFIHDSSKVWPPTNTGNWRLYFNSGNKLRTTVNTNTNDTSVLINKVSGGLTMQEAVDEEFTGVTFNSKFTKRTVYFETDPLTRDYKMIGTPKISLRYSSNGSTFAQYNFQIWEIGSNGSKNFINRLNYTDRNYTVNSVRTIVFNGQAHSHIFKAGSKIRLELTNLDRTPSASDVNFFGTNPFVLPVLINSRNKVYMNSSSYIELPVISPPVSEPMADNNNITGNFSLSQNYPNPFNPVTNISFKLPESGNVKLTVYDITGRLVKQIINNGFEKGIYSINFDGTSLSSGVYLYKLELSNTGNIKLFEDIKRMVLIK